MRYLKRSISLLPSSIFLQASPPGVCECVCLRIAWQIESKIDLLIRLLESPIAIPPTATEMLALTNGWPSRRGFM